jgi:MFS family permease
MGADPALPYIGRCDCACILSAMSAQQEQPDLVPNKHERVKPWASLAFRDFRLLWGGSFFGSLGMQMRQVVNVWLVYELTGSPLQLGLTGLFQALPLLVMGLFVGPLADSADRRKLLFVSQGTGLVLALVLGTLALSGTIQVWHIYVVTTLSSAANSFVGPVRTAMVSNLVPSTHLINALTLMTASQQGVAMFGPLLAGLVIGIWGAGTAYLSNALLLLPALVALLLMREGSGPGQGRPRVTAKAVAEGFRFVWVTRMLLAIIVLDTIVMVFGFYRPLMPVFAKDVLGVGPAGLGLLLSAPAVGAVVATLYLLAAGNVQRKGLLVLAAMALYTISVVLFGVSSWLALSLVIGALLGFADSLAFTPRTAMFQLLSPDHMRGRANSFFYLFAGVANSMGFLVMGVMAEMIGPQLTMMVGGAIGMTTVLVFWAGWRELREFRG